MGPGPGLLPREGQVDLRFLTSWHKPLELELGASHEVKCVLLMSQDIRKGSFMKNPPNCTISLMSLAIPLGERVAMLEELPHGNHPSGLPAHFSVFAVPEMMENCWMLFSLRL